MTTFTFIDQKEDFLEAVKDWEKAKILAIDLECENNMHHFGVYISLIQISTEKKNWIIDILKLKDIPELIKIFHNPNIKKIFHDIGFDFRILDKQFDCKPKNFFDTQIAASLLGKKSIGLGSLLEEYLKVNKESKFQKADWTRRPLSVGMLSYASKDTSYLIPLYKILKKELQEKKRLAWIEQELDSLEHKEFKLRIQKFEDLKKLNTLNPKELGILKKLYQLRRKIAKELDEPVHHIISTKRLFEIAQRPPNVWKRIKRVHPIIYRRASLFQQAVEEGRKHPVEIKKKESKRHTPEEKLKFKQLQDIQKKVAEKQKIPGHLIINKEQMLSLIVKKDKTALRKWQITLLKKEKPKFFV